MNYSGVIGDRREKLGILGWKITVVLIAIYSYLEIDLDYLKKCILKATGQPLKNIQKKYNWYAERR